MANAYEARLRRVITYIYDHPNGDLSLDTLAEVAAMSRFHWHRVFRAMTGETCAQAVKRIRMHRASVALVQTERPIAQIADEVGYPQLASFSRAFSDIYRVSPGAFRRIGRAPAPLAPFTAQTGPDMYQIETRDLPARRLAALPHKGAYPEIGRTFQEVYAVIAARGLFPSIGHGVGIYYRDVETTPVAELESHAGVTLLGDAEVPEGLEPVTIPAARAAVLTLEGPYTGLQAAWTHLYRSWLPNSGEEVANVAPYEVYLNDPTDTAPEDLRTEIVVPLAS